MKTIEKDTTNIGGIAKVWAIPSFLVNIPRQPARAGSFTLPEGFADYAIALEPVFQSSRFAENSKTVSAGILYESAVSLTIAKDSQRLEEYKSDLARRPWSLLTLDQNGTHRLTGSKDFPMRATVSVNTGSEISDLNNVRIEFTGSSPYPSVYLADPFQSL